MAPEILENKAYTNLVDIYSLGVIFYEILYGKPPFTATNIPDLLKNIRDPNVRA